MVILYQTTAIIPPMYQNMTITSDTLTITSNTLTITSDILTITSDTLTD